MAVTNYYSINGEIIGEAASGVRTGYLPDALGSVTATVDESGAVENTYRYKPYGAQLSKSGGGADPSFQWVGQRGYRRNSTTGKCYVRARTYAPRLATWLTVDPVESEYAPYQYARSNPVGSIDPTGLKPVVNPECGDKLDSLESCCDDYVEDVFEDGEIKDEILDEIKRCLADLGFQVPDRVLKSILESYKQWCEGSNPASNVCIRCIWGISDLPADCEACKEGTGASTVYAGIGYDPNPGIQYLPDLCPYTYGLPTDPCAPLHDPKGCGCTVVVCVENWPGTSSCEMLLHEMMHCGGVGGPPGHNDHTQPHKDVIYAIGCCLCRARGGTRACHECRGFNP